MTRRRRLNSRPWRKRLKNSRSRRRCDRKKSIPTCSADHHLIRCVILCISSQDLNYKIRRLHVGLQHGEADTHQDEPHQLPKYRPPAGQEKIINFNQPAQIHPRLQSLLRKVGVRNQITCAGCLHFLHHCQRRLIFLRLRHACGGCRLQW